MVSRLTIQTHNLIIKYIINFVTRSAAQWESVLKKSLAMFLVSQLSPPNPSPPPHFA